MTTPLTRDQIRGMINEAANAEVFEGGNFFRDGVYGATILKIKFHGGFKGTSFIAEHLIDEAQAQFEDVEPNRPGTTASVVVNTSDPKTRSMANARIKEYFCGILGLDPKATPPALIAELIEAAVCEVDGQVGEVGRNAGKPLRANPFRGMKVRNNTVRKLFNTGKSAGYDEKGRPKGVLNKFSRFPQTEEERLARRQELDAQGL